MPKPAKSSFSQYVVHGSLSSNELCIQIANAINSSVSLFGLWSSGKKLVIKNQPEHAQNKAGFNNRRLGYADFIC